jgi:hypothetical protein
MKAMSNDDNAVILRAGRENPVCDDPDFEHGTAVCHNEPRGDFGLEGYLRGDGYRARRYGNYKGQQRYQVQPGSDPESPYWEAMSQVVFKKYFKWQVTA